MFRRKKQNVVEDSTYYDSDAIYRNQSIYGGAPIYQQTTSSNEGSGYVPPSTGYQPPSPYSQERPAEVGYRPPLFPGSAELAEIEEQPPEPETKRDSRKVLSKSLQAMAGALLKVQDRARRSSVAELETEEDRSIKALFTDRIVKGRPDLFVPTTPVPPSPVSEESTPRQNMLQANISGFFSQFAKQQQQEVPQGKWGERQVDFNKRFGRQDAKYLRDAVNNFCDETRRMYASLLPEDYTPTPTNSPREGEGNVQMTPTASTTSPVASHQKIEDRIHSFIDALMNEIHKHKGWRGVTEDGFRGTRDCLEKLIVEELRGYKLGAVRAEMKKDDDELTEKIGYLEFLTVDNLDVPTVCKEHMEVIQEATTQLCEICNVVSPGEKLECIIESCRTLGALLQQGSKNDAGADDFLPTFIYTVLKSGIPKLVSTVEYISRFRHPDELMSEGGYCLTNLSCAVSFLQNCGGCDFDIDPDEFERQYHKVAPSPVVDEDEEDLLQF